MTTTSERIAIVVRPQNLCHLNIYVYFVDLKEEEEKIETTPLQPAFRILHEFPAEMAVVLLNSTIYMFGTFLTDDGWQPKAYTYPLPSPRHLASEPGCPVIGLERCQPKTAMSSEKYGDNAVLIETNSGIRICVYSRVLSRRLRNFELYDPKTDTWWKVPEPPTLFTEYDAEYDAVDVIYHYVDGSRLFIRTIHHLHFIDFNQIPSPKWEEFEVESGFGVEIYDRPLLKYNSSLIFPTKIVFNIHSPGYVRSIHFYEDNPLEYHRCDDQFVVCLQRKDGAILLVCTAQTTRPGYYETLFPVEKESLEPSRLELKLLRFDESQQFPDIVLSKSLLLAPDSSEFINIFWILGIFPI